MCVCLYMCYVCVWVCMNQSEHVVVRGHLLGLYSIFIILYYYLLYLFYGMGPEDQISFVRLGVM